MNWMNVFYERYMVAFERIIRIILVSYQVERSTVKELLP